MRTTTDARYLLSALADAWEMGAQARRIRRHIGMTGTLEGDRRVLNASATQIVFTNVPAEIERRATRPARLLRAA